MCIDKEKNIIFEIDTGYNKEELDCMLSAPEMSNEAVKKVTHKVVEQLPNIHFPMPKSFEMKEIKIEPEPYIYLYAERYEEKIVHAMELYFLYGDHGFNVYPQNDYETMTKEDNIYKRGTRVCIYCIYIFKTK